MMVFVLDPNLFPISIRLKCIIHTVVVQLSL
jgi:hypothetical protein